MKTNRCFSLHREKGMGPRASSSWLLRNEENSNNWWIEWNVAQASRTVYLILWVSHKNSKWRGRFRERGEDRRGGSQARKGGQKKEKTEPRIGEGRPRKEGERRNWWGQGEQDRGWEATEGGNKEIEKRWTWRPGAGGAYKWNLHLLYSLTYWVTLGKCLSLCKTE